MRYTITMGFWFGVVLGVDIASIEETLEYFPMLELESKTTENKATFVASTGSTFRPNRFYPLHVAAESNSFSFERTMIEFKTNCQNSIQQMYLEPEEQLQPLSRVDLMTLQFHERLRLEYKSYLWDQKYPVGTQIGLFIPQDCQVSVLSVSRQFVEPSLQAELDDSSVLEQPLMLSALTKWPFDGKNYNLQLVSNLKTTRDIFPPLRLMRKVEKKQTSCTAYFEYNHVPIEMPSGVYLTLFIAGKSQEFEFDFVKLIFNVKGGKCQRVKHFILLSKGKYVDIATFPITRVKNTLQVEYQSHRLYKMLKTPKTKFLLFIPNDCRLEFIRATRSVMGSKPQIQKIKSEITL